MGDLNFRAKALAIGLDFIPDSLICGKGSMHKTSNLMVSFKYGVELLLLVDVVFHYLQSPYVEVG